jgi:glycosyltransferase involved in cell wall biosynthesis
VTERPLAGRRVLFVVNVDWFFLSHRVPVARAARDAGASVTVATADSGRLADIAALGFDVVALPFTRKGQAPWREALTVLALLRLYLRLRPDVVHHVTIKPVLYGGLVARAALRRAAVINAISGLGFAFSEDRRARRVGRLVQVLYRRALRNPRSRTIFQNPDDLRRFVDQGLLDRRQTTLIRGSGVDCMAFHPPTTPPAGPPVVLLASRLLWEKGVGDFVEAARRVRATRPDVRFVLAGTPDDGNITSVTTQELQVWVDEGAVEWLGHSAAMADLLRTATVFCLPTYYPEGVPKALLEAGATSLALVATDVAGCREVVLDGDTGLLVPPRDPDALAAAVGRLLDDPELARRLGESARARVEQEFSEPLVVAQTMRLYAELLAAAA